MIRRIFAAGVAAVILFSFVGPLLGQGDVVIDVRRPGIAKIKIGIPPLLLESGITQQLIASTEFVQVLRDDLDFTGLFEIYPSPPIDARAEPGKFVPLKAWIPLDVQAVLEGRCAQLGGDMVFNLELFDVESETRIVGRSYRGPAQEVRAIAHTFADEIVLRYTGKRGVASTSIAYVKEQGKNKEINIMDYDGKNSYQLTYDHSIALSPEWSPDGSKLVYTSYKDHNPDVFLIDLNARKSSRLSGYIGLNTTPSISPDGKTLALTLSKDGNPELYLMDIQSRALTRLTKNSGVDTSPTWSPNGREIAFVSDRSGSPQVYVVDREGVNLRRLTYSGSYNTSPAWSPEGDKIVYVSMAGGRGDIYTISPSGSNARRLTYEGGNEDPAWSPDGRYIAFSAKRNGRRDIYLMRADGSGARAVTSGGGDNMSPAWSS